MTTKIVNFTAIGNEKVTQIGEQNNYGNQSIDDLFDSIEESLKTNLSREERKKYTDELSVIEKESKKQNPDRNIIQRSAQVLNSVAAIAPLVNTLVQRFLS
jgi:hypothetical protein